MPLLILGFVFVVGLFIYYLLTTTENRDQDADTQPKPTSPYKEMEENEDIVKDKNVIFLAGDIESMKEKYKHKKQRFSFDKGTAIFTF